MYTLVVGVASFLLSLLISVLSTSRMRQQISSARRGATLLACAHHVCAVSW
jgi:hypothetical protein